MDAATNENNPSTQETDEYYKAEIRRMSVEMDLRFVDMDEKQRSIERLAASTRRTLESIRKLLHEDSSTSPELT